MRENPIDWIPALLYYARAPEPGLPEEVIQVRSYGSNLGTPVGILGDVSSLFFYR